MGLVEKTRDGLQVQWAAWLVEKRRKKRDGVGGEAAEEGGWAASGLGCVVGRGEMGLVEKRRKRRGGLHGRAGAVNVAAALALAPGTAA